MLKNYLKITWKVLSRKNIYSGVTLLGISFPLIIITLVISFITHISSNSYPQTRFNKVVSISRFIMDIEKGGNYWSMSRDVPYKFYSEYIKHFHTPELMCFTSDFETEITGNNKNKRQTVKFSDENFWQMADYKFIEGRNFNKTDVENAHHYAIIDEKSKAHFFGDSSPIGKNLTIVEKSYKVLGVVKNADVTKFQTFANVFIPITTKEGLSKNDYWSGGGNVLILLKDKEDKKLLINELDKTISNFDLAQIDACKKIDAEIADSNYASVIMYNVRLLFNLDIDKDYILPISIILVLFFFVVLPALNLIYINLSRVSERSEEVGIRKGFGGTRNSIFKQFIFENVFITTIGGAIALLLSFLILFLINESQILQGCYIKINGLAFLICIVIWMILSFLSGVLPAMRISKMPIISALHGSVSKNGSYAYRWLRKENIWLSVELCCVFIALFSIINFFVFFGLNLFTPIGFNYNGVYEVKMYNEAKNFIDQDYSTRDDIFEWIAQNPLVLETSRLDGSNPYGSTSHFGESLIYENRNIKGEKVLYVELGIGDWDFWKLKITDGDWINIDDTVSSICPVIINEKLRTELFGKGTAIGKKFEIEKQKFVVKGVIESYKHLGELTSEGYYLFYVQNNKYSLHRSGRGYRRITGYLRFKDGGTGNSQKLLNQLNTKYSNFDFKIEPLNKYRIENSRKSIIPLLFILFLCLSVFMIVLFGMFGVIWYRINLRVPEIGLRKSVGATIPRIFREVISEVYLITLIGLLPGILIIIQFPLLGVFDFSIQVYLISIIVSFLLIFLLVGIFTLLPAKKAAKIQPAIALHEE